MYTFDDLHVHFRCITNKFGRNYFPRVECVIKYKQWSVEMIHVPHCDDKLIGVNVDCGEVIICPKNDNSFEVYPNTRVDV